MPVISDTATLNSQLIRWCEIYCPEYLEHVTGIEFHDLILDLVGEDIFSAAKEIERVTGVEGNEDLFKALGADLTGRIVSKEIESMF